MSSAESASAAPTPRPAAPVPPDPTRRDTAPDGATDRIAARRADLNEPVALTRRDRVRLAAVACIAAVAAVTVLLDPDGIGLVAFLVVVGGFSVAITVGPLARGARPRHVWLPETLAGFFLLISLAGNVWPVRVGPVDVKDITYFTAYALLIVWLISAARYVGRGGGRGAALDSAAATVGTALALWVATLAPVANGEALLWGLVWTVYPTVDILLIALSVHLLRRLGRRVPGLTWLITGLALQFVLDAVTSVGAIFPQLGITDGMLRCGLVIAQFPIAVAACHPNVSQLTRPRRGQRRPRRSRPTLLALALLPPLMSSIIPVTGPIDIAVRTGLLALLLGIVFVRLISTLDAVNRAQADSHHRATHDALTGLLNRAALFDSLERRLVRDSALGRGTAVLFLDCDDFKHVNDTWGHQAGDTLLRDVADRLRGCTSPTDLVARHGGDEFVVVSSVARPGQAQALGEAVRAALAAPLRIRPDRRHAMTSSVGVALAAPGEDVEVADLLRRADTAMYAAKQGGRGRIVVFDDDLAAAARVRARVGDRIEAAIRTDAFCVELQPIMTGPGYGSLVAWEALARWHDAELGEVPPEVFVAAAEQLGLIGPLGLTVLRRACADVVRLHRVWPPGEPLPGLSVNLSPAQLLEPDLVESVRVAAGDLPLHHLRLEVTETLLVDKGPDVQGVLEKLRAAGVRIVIDDFGTGYASLATLLRLPVDAVKLDRSLVANAGVEEAATRQLGAVLDLLRSLGIERIVAEGVETAEQEAALLDLGCPSVQGWRYGRPETADALVDELDAGRPGVPARTA